MKSLGFGTPSAVSGSSATCDAALCSELKGINEERKTDEIEIDLNIDTEMHCYM